MSDTAKIHDMQWYVDVPRSIVKQTTFGVVLLVITFGGFGGWALTAPLAAAIIAQGRFVATGQNKVVQHFEGGIIEEILVSEGDQIRYDQPLIRLDETAALAKERELFLRRVRLEAIASRLSSQIRSADRVDYSDIVMNNRTDPEVAPIIEGQDLNFEAWRKKLSSEAALLRQNIDAFRFRAEGYAKQRDALRGCTACRCARNDRQPSLWLRDRGCRRRRTALRRTEAAHSPRARLLRQSTPRRPR